MLSPLVLGIVVPEARFWKMELHSHTKQLGQVDNGAGRVVYKTGTSQALLEILEAALGSSIAIL